jgi:hypothetical protein
VDWEVIMPRCAAPLGEAFPMGACVLQSHAEPIRARWFDFFYFNGKYRLLMNLG